MTTLPLQTKQTLSLPVMCWSQVRATVTPPNCLLHRSRLWTRSRPISLLRCTTSRDIMPSAKPTMLCSAAKLKAQAWGPSWTQCCTWVPRLLCSQTLRFSSSGCSIRGQRPPWAVSTSLMASRYLLESDESYVSWDTSATLLIKISIEKRWKRFKIHNRCPRKPLITTYWFIVTDFDQK